MMFQFYHSDQTCSAYLEYNNAHSNNLLIVYNLDFNSELGYKIIFYPTEDKKWKTNHEIKNRYPSTYNNLCEKISDSFGENEFTFAE